MKGSARQDRPGSWQLRCYAGTDPVTGKRRYVTRRVKGHKREADKALRSLAAEVDEGRHRWTEGTVGFLLERWFEQASPGWSPTTRAQVALVVRRRLIPELGELRLSRLGAADLDAPYLRMLDTGPAERELRRPRICAVQGVYPAQATKCSPTLRRASA